MCYISDLYPHHTISYMCNKYKIVHKQYYMVAQQVSKQTQKNHISPIDYIGLSTTPIDNVIVEDSTDDGL